MSPRSLKSPTLALYLGAIGAVCASLSSTAARAADGAAATTCSDPTGTLEERYLVAYHSMERATERAEKERLLAKFRVIYGCNRAMLHVLYNIGVTEYDLGLKVAAYRDLNEWIKNPGRNQAHDQPAQKKLAILTKQVSRVEIQNGAVTKVILDGEDIGPDSLFWVLPGHHTIEAWKPNGQHQTWERDAKAGHDIEPSLTFDAAEVGASGTAFVAGAGPTPQKLAPGSAAEANVFTTPRIPDPTTSAVKPEPSLEAHQHATVQTDAHPHDNTRVIVGSVLLAGTAGLLATGIGFEVAATSNKDAAAALLAGHTVPSSGCYGHTSSACASAASKWSAHNTDAVLGTAGFIGTGVAAAFGVATFAGVFSPKAKKDEEPARAPTAVVPLLAPNFAGVSILGQF